MTSARTLLLRELEALAAKYRTNPSTLLAELEQFIRDNSPYERTAPMPRTLPVSTDERRAICSVAVTLNDQPATISGVQNDYYATITDAGAAEISIKLPWTDVAYIAARSKQFYS